MRIVVVSGFIFPSLIKASIASNKSFGFITPGSNEVSPKVDILNEFIGATLYFIQAFIKSTIGSPSCFDQISIA